MYYTIVPSDVLYKDMDKPRKFFDVQRNNVVYKMEEINDDEYMIFDIFSLNLSDYMNQGFSPGVIIRKSNLINLMI
jgi:hypothetical protein